MSYLVLARKYRPRAFSEVAGQDIVTRTLRGAIAEGRVGHAYLFFGPRGTGKTTSARLFAKALNCEKGPTAEPCGVCARCVSYDAGTEADLIEIDAASNTGVDHVRSLRDQAGYVPLAARFKVFLIDEVHMLSRAAFNALLKTLEEPPPHVKFLFATTELHKVPDTVVSRCQVLRLSPLTEDEIRDRLDEVFGLEGISAEPGVTAELARRARGGMRDALSLADQLLALVGRTPTVADTARLAGMNSTEAIEAVLDAILAEDKRALLSALPGREGDEPAFLDGVLDYLRAAMLLKLVGEDAPMLAEAAAPAVRARMAERAGAFGADRLELLLQELLHARERMGPIHMRAHARLILETTLLDLCRAEATMPIGELVRRLEALEGRAPATPSGPAQRPAERPSAPPPAPGGRHHGGPAPGQLPGQQTGQQTGQPAARPAGPPTAGREPRAAAPPASPAPAQAPAQGQGPTDGPDAAPPPGPSAAPRAESAVQLVERELVPLRPPSDPAPRTHSAPLPDRGPAASAAPPRVQTNSTADRWEGFLAELKSRSKPLADVFGRKGTLVRATDGVAPLKLQRLSGDERSLLDDPRSRATVEDAFRAATGVDLRLKLEIHDDAPGGGRDADPFTEELRDLFQGRIER